MTNRRDFLRMATVLAAAKPLALAADETGESFAGEPVLETPAETSVGIAWAVSRLSTGQVEIADNPELKDARIVKSGELPIACLDDQAITVRVTGLLPNTRYWYRTITQEVVSAHNPGCAVHRAGARSVGRIRSFVTPGAGAVSRFAVMNDTHAAWKSFAFTSAALKRGKFPVAIWNGDALNCTDEKRVAVGAILAPKVPARDYASETPLLWTNGNHDYERNGDRPQIFER